MSKRFYKGGLGQYGPEHFEVKPFDIITFERVKVVNRVTCQCRKLSIDDLVGD